MFIEEVLTPLKAESITSITDKEELRGVIIRLFADIEQRPLRSTEVSQIKEAIASNISRLELQNDKQILALLNKRFSNDFLPGVSSLGADNLVPKRVVAANDGTQHQVSLKNQEMHTCKGKMLMADSNSGRMVYQLCSVRRQQTALWSSFKMYADGIKEFDGTGTLIGTTMNDAPLFLYGAKKFKGGAISQSFVWNISDVKQWKDKAAVGKVSKQSNNRYYGCLLPSFGALNNSSSDLPSSAVPAASVQPVEEGSPVVVAEEICSETTNTIETSLSASTQPTEMGAGIADTPVEKVSPRVQSSRWTFRAGSSATSIVAPPTHPSSNHSVSALSAAATTTTSQAVGNDSGIAVCVSCKGMDKLIHLSGLAVKSAPSSGLPRKASAESIEATTGTDTNNTRRRSISTASTINNSVSHINEQELLDQLDALQRQSLPVQDAEAHGLLQIVSKLPRKVPTAGGKTMHSVAFGKESRVRAASRKNLVIESVVAGSAGQAAEATSVEWGADANKLPLLQMGKLEEGTFSLDFHELSPFQAFTIALAAFDQ